MAFLLHKILRHNLFAKLTILRKIKEKPDHHTLVAPLSAVYNQVYNQERVTMTCVLTLKSLIEEHARLNFSDFHSTLLAIFHVVN